MKRVDQRWPLKAVAAGMLLVLSGPQAMAAGDLGIIRVESTTIDDKFEQKRDEASSIGVVSGETVDRSHTQNIQQMIQSIAGVTTEVQSGDSLKIHIRGVENQTYMGERPGVAIVIDGVPVFERTGRVNIDMDNIESIKVIKGGASYLYGDDALSGAVIITTKRGAKMAGVKLGGEIGDFGYEKKLARFGYAADDWNGHIQITNREVDGYYEDSDSKADYINGKLQYYVDDASDLTFGFEQSDRAKNSHGAVRGVTNAENDPESKDPNNEYNDYANHYDVDLEKYFVTYSRDLGETDNLMVNAYQFTDDTKFDSSPATTDPSVYRYANDYQQVQRGIKAEYRAGGERLAWMAAMDLRDENFKDEVTFVSCMDLGPWAGCNVGDLSADDKTEKETKAVYGELKFRLADPLVMTLNGRYERIDFDYTDKLDPADSGDERFDVFSWRLGLNYAFRDNLDFYGNISTGFRTPTETQLFTGSNSPTHRTAANPNLSEEDAFNFELGLRAQTEWFGVPVEVDASVFQLDRKDFIQSSAGVYTTSDDAVYENVGDARNRGLELSLVTDPQRKLSWELAYTYLHAKYTKYDEFYLHVEPSPGCPAGFTATWEDPPGPAPLQIVDCYKVHDNKDNYIPRTPKHVLNLIARYQATPHWLITGEMVTKSSYYADEINQLSIGGHSTFNLLLNYDRKVGPGNWEFFARVDNLTDKEFYNTARSSGDRDDNGVYDAEDLSLVVNQGRTYTAGLAVTF